MYKVILILILVFSPLSVFALSGVELKLEAPKQGILGESLEIIGTVQSENSLEILSVEIGGIEDFRQDSFQTRSQTQIINGKSKSSLNFQIGLTPQKKGSFILGPLRIKTNSGTLDSNTSPLSIIGGNVKNTSSQDTLPFGLYGALSPSYSFLPLSGLIVFLALLGGGFFVLLKRYFSSYRETPFVLETPDEIISREESFARQFENLSLNLDKTQFYLEYNTLLRKYLFEKGIVDIDTYSYEDTKKKQIWKGSLAPYKNYFQESYFQEFSHHRDDLENRKNLISGISSLLRSQI